MPFAHRFGRKPEGMVGRDGCGHRLLGSIGSAWNQVYHPLAPRQAAAFRKIGDEHWTPLNESIDPRQAYICNLPLAAACPVFLRRECFEGRGFPKIAGQRLERFAGRVTGVLDDNYSFQLSHIATDGESYGHHHRHGKWHWPGGSTILKNRVFEVINYAAFLEETPA
ncbi:MAG: hypothetical protein R2788_25380 [Saprospiraceae bacterium]